MIRHSRLVGAALLAGVLLPLATGAATFVVDDTADTDDALPGDGVCADAAARCTLRAALDEANALAGADVIKVTGFFTPATALTISDDVSIDAAAYDDNFTKLVIYGYSAVIQGSGVNPVIVNTSTGSALRGLVVAEGGVDIENDGGLTVKGCVVSFSATGPGIANHGTLMVDESTLEYNSSAGSGAGIRNEGILLLTSSTLRRNSAATSGGGIDNTGTATLVNSTLSGNSASDGGGIANRQGGTLDLSSSTITANTASVAAGIETVDTGSTITVRNTIVAGNDGPDCEDDGAGAVVVRGTSLFGTTSACTPTGPGTVLTAPSDLGPLAFNGGPTLTHAPLPSSAAIDAADPGTPGSGGDACPTADQRGGVRPVGSRCDIGAVEGPDLVCSKPFQGCLPSYKGDDVKLAPGRLLWRGNAAPVDDPTTTSVALCVYDNAGGAPRLLLGGVAPAGGTCSGRPCWSVFQTYAPTYYVTDRYTDPDLTPKGVRTFLLTNHGRSKVRGKGPLLDPITPPLVPPVMTQVISTAPACFETEYNVVKENSAIRFRGVSAYVTP